LPQLIAIERAESYGTEMSSWEVWSVY